MLHRHFCLITGFMLLGILFLLISYSSADERAVPAAVTAPAETPAPLPDWTTLLRPNENHNQLDVFAGQWNFTVRVWSTPKAEPVEIKGVGSNKWILDKRFLQQDLFGKINGENFEGMGLTGYDNMKKEYQSVWTDNKGTGMVRSTGKFDPIRQVLSERGEYSSPITGETAKKFRSEWKLIDADTYSYEMYTHTPDGDEFKTLAIFYERRDKELL